jgi:glycerol uptake facilitator-like aquaporin
MENKGECEVKTLGGYVEVFLYEFLGTVILMSTICFFPASGHTAIVLSLFIAIITNNGKTGGHFNPAVTTAVLIGRKCYGKIVLVLVGYYLP